MTTMTDTAETAGLAPQPEGDPASTGAQPGAARPHPAWRRAAAVAEKVKAEAARTEGTFAAAGDDLFAAMQALTQLIAACEELTVELDSPDVRDATASLEAVAPEVASVGREEGRRGELLRSLLALADGISWGVDGALAALRPVSIIAMNAKVEAARLGDEGVQFTDFADEISAAFRVALSSLQAVGEHMAALRAPLQVACRREGELAARISEALEHVPERIAGSIQSITSRSASAAAVAVRISEQSRTVSAGASDAVVSLQVGDSARQRLEHTVFALDLAEEVGLRGAEAVPGDAAAMAEAEALLAACCDLHAAQLDDSALALSGDLKATVGALEVLAGAAENVSELGRGLFNADHQGRSFLAQLAQSIGQAQTLFAQLEQAWGSADELISSVSHMASDLEAPIAAVASAEKEVRRLALNAIVKSGRVGERGRALAVIAQQLEGCVELTTEQTAAVVAQLGELAALAQELAEANGNGARQSVSAAGRSMEQAMERLGEMARRVSEGLGRLRDDSAAIAKLIHATAEKLSVHRGAAATLEEGAALLRSLSAELASPARPSGEPAREALQRIFRVYTMAREREIHIAVLGPLDEAAPQVAVETTALF
jgi:hypothetical protein